MEPHRAGTIAVVGRPNVGKSTLVNRLVGQKLSITSRRPQTTRHRILGVVSRPGAQYVFVDTPGLQSEHGSVLNRRMQRTAIEALREVDVIVLVVEALRLKAADRAAVALLPPDVPVLLAANKVDLVKDKRVLLPFIESAAKLHGFEALVPVSAKTGSQAEELLAALLPWLPEGPPLYAPDALTDRHERFLAAELVREKLFRLLGEELPYAAAVEIERFEVEGRLRRISAAILVDKRGQKAIVIGKAGDKLKAIGTQARIDMEKLFGSKVFLELWVKVKPGWMDDPVTLKRLGYD
jgi:GTP-binding protein Era